MAVDKEQLWRSLLDVGESQVRENLAQKIYGEAKIPLVKEWLHQQETSRLEMAASRAETREDESIFIAREANDLASQANNISRQALKVAAVAAFAAIISIAISIFK